MSSHSIWVTVNRAQHGEEMAGGWLQPGVIDLSENMAQESED